jgi:hypothetical protein
MDGGLVAVAVAVAVAAATGEAEDSYARHYQGAEPEQSTVHYDHSFRSCNALQTRQILLLDCVNNLDVDR